MSKSDKPELPLEEISIDELRARGIKIHDCGPRGVNGPMSPALEHALFAPYLRERMTEEEAFRRIRDAYSRPIPNLVSDEITPENIRDLLKEQRDFGLRWVSFGVGTVPFNRDNLTFATKVSLTKEQASALNERLVPVFVEGKVVRQNTFEEIRARAQSGLQRFIDANPGVTVGPGPGPFLVAIYEDGHAVGLDAEGNIIESMSDEDLSVDKDAN